MRGERRGFLLDRGLLGHGRCGRRGLVPLDRLRLARHRADSIKSGLEIVPVSRMDEVLARAMTRKAEPIEWDETATTAAAMPEEAPVEEQASTLTAH